MKVEIASMAFLCAESFVGFHHNLIKSLVEKGLGVGVLLVGSLRSLVIPGMKLLHTIEFPVEIVPRRLQILLDWSHISKECFLARKHVLFFFERAIFIRINGQDLLALCLHLTSESLYQRVPPNYVSRWNGTFWRFRCLSILAFTGERVWEGMLCCLDGLTCRTE